MGMLAAIAVAIALSTAVTYILGFDSPDQQVSGNEEAAEESCSSAVQGSPEEIDSVARGEVIPLEQVNDPVFSQKLMGDGVGVRIEEDVIHAPVSGKLALVAETCHAFGIITETGQEVLVHIGIDTVKENGNGFRLLRHEGESVRLGDPVIEVNRSALGAKGYDLTTMIILTNPANQAIEFVSSNTADCSTVVGKPK